MKRWGFLMVLFACSLYGQWEADKRLTVYPNYHDYGSCNNARTIAVQDTMVHIVWGQRVIRGGAGFGEIYYIKSINSGSSFSLDKRIATINSYYPSVAVCNSIVHVVWIDTRDGKGEIYYKRSVNNGENWGIDERLTFHPAYSSYPSIAVCDSIVHVVWDDTRDDNGEIYYKRSIDNGMLWGADERLTNDLAGSSFPSVAVCDSIVHIVWADRRDGNREIYYKRSVDNGVNWEIDKRLTNDPAVSYYPSIAVCDSMVHIVWYDWRNDNWEIYYKRSVDNGVNWEIDERLTDNFAISHYPSVAVCDSIVHVVWTDERDSKGEIYYKRSFNNGMLWGADERLTNTASLPEHVSVACWNCSYDYDVHIAWTDERDGNQEIYYKRHKCEGTSVEESKELKVKSLELRVFPNPFTQKTVIRYSLNGNRNDLRLTIYDITGRIVKTLVSEEKKAGYYTVNFDAKDLRAGIYFVKLVAGDFKETKKLILMR